MKANFKTMVFAKNFRLCCEALGIGESPLRENFEGFNSLTVRRILARIYLSEKGNLKKSEKKAPIAGIP
jgi:hypothetical protein